MVLWILMASRSWRCNYILPSKLGETDRSRGRWLVVSTEQLFLKIGTPDSAALFYTRTTSLNWDNAKYSDFETSWQNLPNEAVDFKHFYLHLHCTTVSLQSGETLLETDNFENIGDSMAKSPKVSWQLFERLFHLICIYEHIFSERSSKYVSCIAMRCHTGRELSQLATDQREGGSIRDEG